MWESLLGVIIGAGIPIIKDFLSGRRAEKLERIKLHDAQKLKAYQIAYKFTSTLRMSLKDATQSKDLAFLNGCAKDLYLVIENLPYFSKRLIAGFVELENVMESIMSDIMNIEGNVKLIDEKVKPLSERLRNEIVSELEMWC